MEARMIALELLKKKKKEIKKKGCQSQNKWISAINPDETTCQV